MNEKARRSLSAFESMVRFIRSKHITGGRITTALATLEQCIANIRDLGPVQLITRSGRIDDGISRAQLRARIRQDQMIPIARDGRPEFASDPTILRALRVPHAKASDAEVAAAASAMVATLQPYVKLFVEIGYDKSFLATLAKDAKALEGWSTHTAVTAGRRTAANAALDSELKQGRQAAGVLDGLMKAHGRANPGVAKEWARAKRLPKKIGRPRAAKKRRAATASAE